MKPASGVNSPMPSITTSPSSRDVMRTLLSVRARRCSSVHASLSSCNGARDSGPAARVIDGLYAVGELTGGYFYHTYLGGPGLIRGAVMGRVAAQDAVALL